MARAPRPTALLVALAIAALPGCGGDEDPQPRLPQAGETSTDSLSDDLARAGTTTTERPAKRERRERRESPATTAPEAPAPTPKGEAPAPKRLSKQAVEACKQAIRQNKTLTADVRRDLEDLCEQAASGDSEALRKATVDVCRKLVEQSGVRDGSAKRRALKACDQASQR